jgi:hypothetical protein
MRTQRAPTACSSRDFDLSPGDYFSAGKALPFIIERTPMAKRIQAPQGVELILG